MVTPVQARFSIENLVEEEAIRQRLQKDIEGENSSKEEEIDVPLSRDEELRSLFGEKNMADIRSIMDEANQKTTDDLDLQPFLHRWNAASAEAFAKLLDLRLPDCLVAVLHPVRELQQSSAFVNLVLKGDWIPTLFPDSCPEPLARWLFSCVCYGDDGTSAAAWDAWTVYFGRTALWDPDDASFAWFENGKHRAAIEWVPDWKLIVATLGNFGAPTAPYMEVLLLEKEKKKNDRIFNFFFFFFFQGVAFTGVTVGNRLVRDDPPIVDRVRAPVPPKPELSASFPASRFRRLFSLLGLCFYASAHGRLFNGAAVYSTHEISLLVQICFSCLVDPLLVPHPKREFSQCIAAAVQGYPDEYLSLLALCEHLTFFAPRNEMQPLVSAVSLFSPTTARAQWLKRCFSFWISQEMLKQRLDERHPTSKNDFRLPVMKEAFQSRENMLEQMCIFLEALLRSFSVEKLKGRDFMWLFGLFVCLDLTLGDRTAIFSSVLHADRVSDLLKELQDSFRNSGEEMNEFASAARTALSLMKERINYNIRFEKNRLESVEKLKAANVIGGGGRGGKQTELNLTPLRK